MSRDDTLVERRALVIALVACVVGGVALSVVGHPDGGLALLALAAVCFAVEHARGHLR